MKKLIYKPLISFSYKNRIHNNKNSNNEHTLKKILQIIKINLKSVDIEYYKREFRKLIKTGHFSGSGGATF